MRTLLAIAGLLAAWQAGAVLAQNELLPGLGEIAPALWDMLRSGDILPDLLGSLRRLALGLGFGLLFGVPLGVLAGRFRRVEQFMAPVLALVYPVPKAALMPLTLLWFGAGDLSKVVVIAATASLPAIYPAQQGAAGVEQRLIWSAQAMKVGPARMLWRVILPGALPEILLGARVALVLGVIVTITSEMIVRQVGLGNELFASLDMGQYAYSYAVVFVIAALAFGLDAGFEAGRKRLTRWAPQPREFVVAAGSQ